LRTLVRNARKEASLQQPPKSSRALFKLIRSIFEQDHPELSTEGDDTDMDDE
jgi:ribosome-associated protein